jgi:hypothetical protein
MPEKTVSMIIKNRIPVIMRPVMVARVILRKFFILIFLFHRPNYKKISIFMAVNHLR